MISFLVFPSKARGDRGFINEVTNLVSKQEELESRKLNY